MKNVRWLVSLLFSLDASYEQTVRRYQPCFCYSCLFGCFSFSTSSLPSYIILTPFISVAPCFMLPCTLHPLLSIFGPYDRSTPLHCYTLFVPLNLGFSSFFSLLQWKDALDIIIPSSAGEGMFFFFSIYFSSYFYFYLFLYLPLTSHTGSWAHPSPTASRSRFFSFFTVTYLWYITFVRFLFFCRFFNRISKKARIFFLSFFSQPPY